MWSNGEVRSGQWLRAENTGWELEGSTVGIIGYGHMGSAFAERLQGFGVNAIAYDKFKSSYSPNHVLEVDLDTLLERSDVISLHVPLTPKLMAWSTRNSLRNAAETLFPEHQPSVSLQSEAL